MDNNKMTNDKDYNKGPIAWMAGNSVTSNIVMAVLILGGLFFCMTVKQEVFPEFDMDMVSVTVPYPGASPQEVESGIILALEEALRGIDGVDKVNASANEGSGSVTVTMIVGYDLQKLTQDVKTNVDRIVTFPLEAEEPQVVQLSNKKKVITLILYGDQSDGVLREKAEEVREIMLQDKAITQVELSGVRPYEISIEVPQEALRKYGLTLSGIASKLRQSSIEIPGGGIKTSSGEIMLKMKERRYYADGFARLPVKSLPDGTELLLSDIAVVKDTFREIDQFASFNGKPAVMIDVFRVGDQTPGQVALAVQKNVQQLNKTLPDGVRVDTWEDKSKVLEERKDLLMRNASLGLCIVFVLLGLFLEVRLAFWVMMGIPISFLGTMLFMPAMDVTINMVSLFAFIISLGIVVDDAIVVGENIYSHHQKGLPFIDAAKLGARQMAMPVTFSILTNIVAFMPLFFVPGIMGKIFKVIPAIVITVFLISLVEALFILPAHLGHQTDGRRWWLTRKIHDFQQVFSHWFIDVLVKKYYGRFLDKTLRYRYITLACGVSILVLSILYVSTGRIGVINMPTVESNYAVVTAKLPYGSPVEDTVGVRDYLIEKSNQVMQANGGKKLVKGVYSLVGASERKDSGPVGGASGQAGGHIVRIMVAFTDGEIRPIGATEYIKQWRKAVGQLAGLDSLYYQDNYGGPGAGAALSIRLEHKDMAVLESASGELAQALGNYPIVSDIDDGFTPGKPQLDFRILPQGQSLGLTASDIARQVRNSFYGAEVLRQQRGRNEMRVMVRLPKENRISEYDLEQMVIKVPKQTPAAPLAASPLASGMDASDGEVMLTDVVEVIRSRTYTSIKRTDGRRVVTLTANVQPKKQTGRIQKAIKAKGGIIPALKAKYPALRFSPEGKQEDMQKGMAALVKGFIVAMLVVYALLAIPFNSYFQPLIIMVSIPFGIVGAVIGHVLMDYSLSMISMMGIVALSGVVVNDVLILIDCANQQRKQGLEIHDAIHMAGVMRFRPIMLTTLTTFGGLAPMIMETSRQARFLIPMAISLGFGIVFATLITLCIAPSLYLMLDDIGGLYRGRK